ncbi:kinase-like protein [Daldinia bambusicola]|nr:kinase-like protein [Daldinia bambusicola]
MAQDHTQDSTQDSARISKEDLESWGINPNEVKFFESDPFTCVKKFGADTSKNRSVCQVRNNKTQDLYVRKEYKCKSQDKKFVKSIWDEAKIIQKLEHHHVVKIFEIHYVKKEKIFGFLMQTVANQNLGEFFEEMEKEKDMNKLGEHYKVMCQWPICLFHALDYLHESKIRHKDIKPSNILIKDKCIYLTDFGISKDFSEVATSITDSLNPAGTERYKAPENYIDEPRGRATDVWALGCTVLEICTVASGNTVKELNRRLPSKRPPCFYICAYDVLAWVFFLLQSLVGKDTQVDKYIRKTLQLTFLMLDPDHNKRVTMSKILDLLRENSFASIASLACNNCKGPTQEPDPDRKNTFKMTADEDIYMSDITRTTEAPWEKIKQRWLESYS